MALLPAFQLPDPSHAAQSQSFPSSIETPLVGLAACALLKPLPPCFSRLILVCLFLRLLPRGLYKTYSPSTSICSGTTAVTAGAYCALSNATLIMASLRVPAPTPVPTSTLANRRSFHMPLSSHGMPKAPRALSPERPHRFSTILLPSPPAETSPMTPLSPGPMSPPMSAKSFGTFIDSAPSTPAYSPRQEGGEWSNSQITILRPMSSSSLPSSPTEPAWEMMAPVKQPPSDHHSVVRPKLSTASSTPFALSKPIKRSKVAAPASTSVSPTTTTAPKTVQATSEKDSLRKEAEERARKLVEEEEAATTKPHEAQDKSQPQPSPKTDTAPLGKLATRMKSLLRRNTSEKKKEKNKKQQQEFDRLEDAHWSEM